MVTTTLTVIFILLPAWSENEFPEDARVSGKKRVWDWIDPGGDTLMLLLQQEEAGLDVMDDLASSHTVFSSRTFTW